MSARSLLLVILIGLLTGCSGQTSSPATIKFSTERPLTPNDHRAILFRLAEHTSGQPKYEMDVAANGLTIRASAAPNEQEIKFLLSHQGNFTVGVRGGPTWLSERDVVDASAGFDQEKKTALHLRLSTDAAQRVAEHSTKGPAGTSVAAVLDGEVLFVGTSAPLTDGRVQIPLGRPGSEVMLLRTVLLSGALTTPLRGLEVVTEKPSAR